MFGQSILCAAWFPYLAAFLCGLIGYLIGSAIMRAKWGRKYEASEENLFALKGNHKQLQADYDSVNSDYSSLSTSYSEMESQNASLNLGLQDWQGKHKTIEAEWEAFRLSSGNGNIEWESRYKALQADFDGLKAESDSKENEIKAKWELKFNELNREYHAYKSDNEIKLTDWATKFSNLEGEFGTYKLGASSTSKDTDAKLEEWKLQIKDLKGAIQEREGSISNLKVLNTELTEKVENAGLTYQARLDDWELKYNNLEFRYKDLNGKLNKTAAERATYQARLTVREKEMLAASSLLADRSKSEIDTLKLSISGKNDEIKTLKAKLEAGPVTVANVVTEADKTLEAELLKDPKLAKIKAKAAGFDFGRIGLATISEKDDLKHIKGIGAYTEKKLSALGIYTFRQLANLSDEDIPKVNDAIEFFKGRVKRDDWRGQAQAFLENAPLVVVGMGFKKDDLKIVEGIGPKIEGLLHDAGIKTWKMLSETEVEKLQGILDKAGSRYRIHNPETWPKQAELANKENWKELEKWQDELNGGKKK